jgi:hypothetical protein
MTNAGGSIGVRLADNELGWRMALDKLAALVAGSGGTSGTSIGASPASP